MENSELTIKKGYKQTDVGIIPEDWESVELESKANIIDSLHLTPAFSNEGFAMVRVTDIKTGNLNLDSTLKVSESVYFNFTRNYKPKRGDIVLARVGSYGVSSFVETSEPFCMGQNTVVIEPKTINRYLYYILNSKETKRQIEDESFGTGYKSLSLKNIKELKIPLPPLPEQQAIAEVLSDVDALITSLDQLITKKRNIKQGTMQLLLTGKKRLAGFSGEWTAELLPKVCWFQEGPGLRQWQFTHEGMKVINVTNLEKGYLNLDRTDRHISLQEFNNMYKHFEIDDKDIVIASSGNSYSKVAVVRKQDLPLLMNTSVIRFKPLNSLNYDYLLAFLKSKDFKDQIDLMITGGAQPNFGPAHLKKIEIPLPPTKEEQKAIAQILSEMDAEIEALETQRDKYKAVKQGMMQELLTGKTRLPVAKEV